MVARNNQPKAAKTDQVEYHLFLDLADTVGATDERFLMANPVMGAVDAPEPSGRLEYKVHTIQISVAADTEVIIRNSVGTVWKIDAPGGAGSFPIGANSGLSVGKGEYPRLTMDTTEKITVHLFCTMEPVPFIPAR